MKFRKIFSFECTYQLRRPWPWLSMMVVGVFAFFTTRIGILPVTLPQDFILNSPFIVTSVTMLSCQIWLLVAPAVAGEAAARDVATRIHPLVYTSPVSKSKYLGGRFLAALAINALILLGVQVGSLMAVYAPGLNPDIVGPFRPVAYLAAYGLIALPNALIATAFQFAVALSSGRPMASYAGSLLLFFLTYPVTMVLYRSGWGERALLVDPIGVMAIMNEMMSNWTLVEKNVRLFTLEGAMLLNRWLWIGIALGTLAFTYLRFSFAHRTEAHLWRRLTRRWARKHPAPGTLPPRGPISVPSARRSFGWWTRGQQTLAIAGSSFRMIATSPAGIFLLVVFPMFAVVVLMTKSEHWGIPLLPRTGYILSKYLTAPLTLFTDFRVIVPLLIVYFAGELVWRERDAGMSENVDATPVADGVLFVGKLVGLGLVLATLMVSLTAAGVISQTLLNYHAYEPAQYLLILFGFQLPEYLLLSVLALLLHTVADQKYVGMLAALVAYLFIVFASFFGVGHNLLVYGSSPAWYFTDMRGFGPTVGPWFWFKSYWMAWAVLLAVVARLFWVRGVKQGWRARLRIARHRFTRTTLAVALAGLTLLLTLGGFIFYNTNVLNEYITDDELVQRRADYERQYGKFESLPQPVRTATKLYIEIYPDRRTATIRGSYRLVNRSGVPIDSVHLEPAFYVKTRMAFNQPARLVVADDQLGHYIYALDSPLQPGDSLTLRFDVRFKPQGFANDGSRSSGAGIGVVENGTYLASGALPVIGYQPMRELMGAEDRREQGLPRQVSLAAPSDIGPGVAAGTPATFEAVIGTNSDQVAVAPGELRSTWRKGQRRYFHYASDVPISGTEVFFSANYAVHREQRKGVDIQLYVHPGHTKHMERLLRSVRASLEYYSTQFGPYPYQFLQIVEQPGNFFGMGVDGSGVITGGEGFFLFDPQSDGFDGIFEVTAHEMGHQWWGMQLKPALAEGGGVISESLAWYSAMQLVKHTKGREALRRFMSIMRQPDPWPPMRTGLPLLRAMDPWANYRKGPYAMHALSEYVGEERVNAALRTLVKKKTHALATTLDLYHELRAVTPDSLQPLLHDLFAANTVWTFDTKQAMAKQKKEGTWLVTFEVDAHKVVADSAGVETGIPVDQWVEIGIFAAAEPGERLGKPLYVQKHWIRSGTQTITVTVPDQPARGGIDPYNLLDWEEGDNIEGIRIEE